jgi:DNA (cytosine-5)-methyltransferase 1
MDADTLTQLVPAVTSKWAKGSGGPSGDETQNLVTFQVEPERGQGSDLVIKETDLSPALDANRNERGVLAVTFAENQRGELREAEVAMQLTAGGGKPGSGYAGVREGLSVRRLMPIEAERLQGLPDDWTAPTGKEADTNRYASIGNAVTATVGEWIGSRLLRLG